MILLENGRYKPVFACDACGRLIEDAAGGIEVSANAGQREGELVPAYHAHRGECDQRLRLRLGTKGGWDDLTRHAARLIHNAGIAPGSVPALFKDLVSRDAMN